MKYVICSCPICFFIHHHSMYFHHHHTPTNTTHPTIAITTKSHWHTIQNNSVSFFTRCGSFSVLFENQRVCVLTRPDITMIACCALKHCLHIPKTEQNLGYIPISDHISSVQTNISICSPRKTRAVQALENLFMCVFLQSQKKSQNLWVVLRDSPSSL